MSSFRFETAPPPSTSAMTNSFEVWFSGFIAWALWWWRVLSLNVIVESSQ